MKPIIGITAWMEDARWLEFEGKAALLEEAYLTHITQAGGVPVVVPPYEELAGDIADSVDALVIGGGEDVDPARYGEEPHTATRAPRDPNQDAGELAITAAAIERGLPVLAICRGCQVLNVLYGGGLIQHLREVEQDVAHASVAEDPQSATYIPHRVRAEKGSAVAAALGEEFEVQSWHHQGIGRVGDGLEPVARADDGLVEAIADPEREFVLGIQWHPEAESGNAIFEALVEAAAAARRRRASTAEAATRR
jgi:putative glutamine amidotransferase